MSKDTLPTEKTIQKQLGTAQSQYEALKTHRTSLEQTWRDCSALTLPYIFPEEHVAESAELPTPYNSIGPAGINNLTSKLLLTLLPPTGNFFRLLPLDEVVADMEEEQLQKVDADLSKLEQDIIAEIDRQALRVPLFEALKYLTITGNTVIYKVPDGGIKTFSPYRFVVERDYVGSLLKIVLQEPMARSTLPKFVQEMIEEVTDESNPDTKIDKAAQSKNIDIYTVVARIGPDKFATYQEVSTKMIKGTYKVYSEESLPYIPLRWTASSEDYYGRGIVEQYLGDLRRLEGLSQLIVEGAGVQAKTVYGLRPGAQVKVDDLNNAYNGDVILGNLETDVTTWKTDKSSDFRVPMQVMQSLESRVSRAFLMLSGQVRDSERTTATEVRATAAELEATLGGTFSVLAAELQLPLIRLIMGEINKGANKLVSPTIVTGTSAISREKDLNNLQTMLGVLGSLGEETIRDYLDVEGYLTAVSVALGFDPSAMVKSSDQRKSEQEQRAAMEAQAGGQPPMAPQPQQ